MPVVLKPQAWRVWLGEQPVDVPHLKALLVPYASDEMICWPVSARVGSVKTLRSICADARAAADASVSLRVIRLRCSDRLDEAGIIGIQAGTGLACWR